MTMTVYQKETGVMTHYRIEDIVAVKFVSYKDLAKSGHYDLQDYKKSEIFMCICFKDGNVSHFPTSLWNIEF